MTAPTRVLVTGAGGQVGVDLVDTLAGRTPPGADYLFQPDGSPVSNGEFDVVALTRAQLDVTSRSALVQAFRDYRPDVVVNLAAYTRVDAAETDAAACRVLNCDAPVLMSTLSHEIDAHFITISTDFVFDGDKGEPYQEGDATNPLNVYGLTKRDGERGCAPNDTVVRTSWVMGVRGRNIAHVVAARVRAGERVRFVDDQIGTPTFSADLARALVTLVRQRPGGLWHVANAGAASWYDVAAEIARVLTGDDTLVDPIATSDLVPAQEARRPARSDLATRRWLANSWTTMAPWREGLSRFLADC